MREHESGWGATLDRLKELIARMSDETRSSTQDSV
jgi:hypothetical protein